MKKLAIILIAITILVALFITFQPASANFNSIFFQSACNEPIKYRIGTVDPQFEVSENQFKTYAAKGTDIWEKTYNKNLFEYDPNATLKINLIFDERQQNFEKTRNISDQVKDLGGEVDTLGNELSQDKKSLEPEILEYQKRVQAFNTRAQKLNTDIQYWNSQGGAPEAEYQRLNREREAVKDEAEALNQRSKELENLKQSYNNQVGQYNDQISKLNQKTGQLNQSIQNLQQVIDEKPEEGLYDPQTQTIDIYFNIEEAELIQTLAHELGHARGLGHNDNKESIMYSFTNKQSSPSVDDLAQLDEVCKEKSLPEIFTDKASTVFTYYQQLLQN